MVESTVRFAGYQCTQGTTLRQAGLTFPMSHLPRRLAILSLVLLILVTLFSYGRVPEYLKAGVPASGPIAAARFRHI